MSGDPKSIMATALQHWQFYDCTISVFVLSPSEHQRLGPPNHRPHHDLQWPCCPWFISPVPEINKTEHYETLWIDLLCSTTKDGHFLRPPQNTPCEFIQGFYLSFTAPMCWCVLFMGYLWHLIRIPIKPVKQLSSFIHESDHPPAPPFPLCVHGTQNNSKIFLSIS